MIAIIDYGMGNLHSVRKGLEKVGADVCLITQPEQIPTADKLILPGVGAFRDAIATLRDLNLVEPIRNFVRTGKPFLGICLGLQLLFDVSYEDGEYPGLGIIPGKVIRFDFNNRPDADQLKIPHMGWNALQFRQQLPLYRDLPPNPYVYFVHSYYVQPENNTDIATLTDHGFPFVSSIARDNIFATQFHPEKSQQVGLTILRNFTSL